MSQSNNGGDVPSGSEPLAGVTPPTKPRDDDLVPDTLRKRPDPSDDTHNPALKSGGAGVPGTHQGSGGMAPPAQASSDALPSTDTHQIFARNTAKRPAALSVERTNLDGERILRDASRIKYEGADCPSLGGIPLLAKLGEGGMGTVYYGIHPRLNSEVAVKVLPFHLAERDPTLINRFVREAQIAAHVRSTHLVHVLDVNQDKGLYFLVMEYVCGLTGAKALIGVRRSGKVGLAQLDAIDVCVAAGLGLKAAHERGVVHRDIKPDNIIIPFRLPSDELSWSDAKLMDLGLARMQHHQGTGLTATESSMGTPGYMSPEQALDAKSATQRSDIFSMGAALYGMLAGRSPFQRESSMKTLFATVHEAYAPLTNFRDDVHPSVVSIVERCLIKDAERRYENVEQFIAELRTAREMLTLGMVPPRNLAPAPSRSHNTDVLPSGTGRAAPADSHSTFIRTSSQALREQARTPDWATRKRAAVLAAAGLCTALMVGTGYVVLRTPAPAMNPEKRKIFEAEHTKVLKRARTYAEDGHFMEAGAQVEMASRLGLDEAPARQEEQETQKFIADTEKGWTQKYQQQLVAFDAIIEGQALENAPAALDELKKYAPRDDSEARTIAAREKALASLQELRKQETASAQVLDTIAEMEPGLALQKLTDLDVTLNSPAFKVSKAREDLEKRLQDLFRKKATAKDQLDKQHATEVQKQEFTALLNDADKELKAGGDFAAADEKLNEAAKRFPADPELAGRRERLDALKAEKQRGEKLAAALKAAGELIDKAAWDDAEAKLKEAEALTPGAPDPQIATLRQRAKEQQADALRKATEKEKRDQADALLAKADALLADGNLAEASKKLDTAVEVDPGNPNLKARQDRLAARKAEQAQQLETLVREADSFLANDAQLAEAEKRIDAAAKIVPGDPRLKTLREKFNDAKTAAVVRERARQERAKLQQDLKTLEDALPAADDAAAEKKLEVARTAFAALEASHKGEALLDATREKVAQRGREIQHAHFAAQVASADAAIAKDPDAAEKILNSAESLFPKDPLLESARQHLKKRREELSAAADLEVALKELDAALASNGSFNDVNAKFNRVVRLSPDNPKLENYRNQVADRKRQVDFTDLLKAAAVQLRRDELDDAEASLASAAKIFPTDPQLAESRRNVAQRRAEVASRQQTRVTTPTTTTGRLDSTKVGPNADGGSVGEEKQ